MSLYGSFSVCSAFFLYARRWAADGAAAGAAGLGRRGRGRGDRGVRGQAMPCSGAEASPHCSGAAPGAANGERRRWRRRHAHSHTIPRSALRTRVISSCDPAGRQRIAHSLTCHFTLEYIVPFHAKIVSPTGTTRLSCALFAATFLATSPMLHLIS